MELPAQLEVAGAWHDICRRLRAEVGESEFEIWLAPLEVKGWDGTLLVLQAPPSTQAWVSKRFGAKVQACVREVLGDQARTSFDGHVDTRVSDAAVRELRTGVPPALNPRLSFDQFIIGDGNRLAHAAALAVAENPGQTYNPLFLHAPPGLGKTHLLHAIGNYLLHFGGGATVRYTTVEAFTNHFVGALASRSVERFKEAYRNVDVLLIDDVQFLASKARTEEEFFHTFNALHGDGRQLVLTCDRLPSRLTGVEERLRERFEAGLVAAIAPPDLATRMTILRKRIRLDNLEWVPEDVLRLVAERVADNVRALEGALIRIVAHHSLTGQPLDLKLARAVLDDLHPVRNGGGAPTIDSIQQTVADFYDILVSDLLSASRAARVTWPRQVAIQLCRELTAASLPEIGAAFGGRNHATVLHACRRVNERAAESVEVRGDLESLAARAASARGAQARHDRPS